MGDAVREQHNKYILAAQKRKQKERNRVDFEKHVRSICRAAFEEGRLQVKKAGEGDDGWIDYSLSEITLSEEQEKYIRNGIDLRGGKATHDIDDRSYEFQILKVSLISRKENEISDFI